MNDRAQIHPIVMNDDGLETEFVCMINSEEWSIKANFRFHSAARCVRITAIVSDTERCVNLRADKSAGSAGYQTAHLTVIDNQIPWAHSNDFEALKRAISVSDWISRFLCLTAEKPAANAQTLIENMCAELAIRLSNGASLFGPCL